MTCEVYGERVYSRNDSKTHEDATYINNKISSTR
jgi:hypothetical protein